MDITVKTDKGQIKGVQKTGYQEFLGIPYAKPPVGKRRFCAPESCDARFRIPGLILLEAQSRHQSNVFSYLFTWESPARRGALGACHALDLPFVFGTFYQRGQDKFAGTGPDVEKLSGHMMDAWIAFAKSGNPSHEGIGNWEPYTSNRRETMIFGRDTRLESAPFEEERSILDEILSV